MSRQELPYWRCAQLGKLSQRCATVMLTQALVTAFNAVIALQSVLTSMPLQEPAAAASSSATVAVSTSMLATPNVKAEALCYLR